MKDKTTAALLALFLGGIGMHKFYLGKTGTGVIYILFCWTFLPAFISLIEAIVLFSMSEQSFNEKYNNGFQSLYQEAFSPDTHVRCPDCKELIRKDAKKCKHCGTAIIPS
jgi:TM2 domain-containing membrane protein YozV